VGLPHLGLHRRPEQEYWFPLGQNVNMRGVWANITPRSNRNEPICFSSYLYRARNLVEWFLIGPARRLHVGRVFLSGVGRALPCRMTVVSWVNVTTDGRER
jgi:hypothetical protein